MLINPTSYPEINQLLKSLFEQVQAILGNQFVGMYLDGSLATGAFDQDSDIDFVVVTETDVTGELFAALQTMHDRLAALSPLWGTELEGSYISRAGLRRYDPAHVLHPNIERGLGERLKWAAHDATWDFHRSILRERGIPLDGPDLRSLIDPVTPAQLQQAAQATLTGWAVGILREADQIQARGYQSYTVLSLCRILYTCETGKVATKPAAARWAQERLGEPWAALIERAWMGRHHSDEPALPEDIRRTLDFIRYALARGQSFRQPESPE